jgi:signal transduction histidine kinase
MSRHTPSSPPAEHRGMSAPKSGPGPNSAGAVLTPGGTTPPRPLGADPSTSSAQPGSDADARPTQPDPSPGGSQPGSLVDAVVAMAGNLDAAADLDKIVRSACELTGSRYAALGVLSPAHQGSHERTLAQFYPTGVSPELQAEIGELPRGRGVLGVLIEDPRPLRLPEIAAHPASVGFPAHHPPMRTFLGVPVHVRGAVFGSLYLAEKASDAEFTEEDERIVLGLAAAAGVAIENAELFAESRLRQRWLAASAQVVSDLAERLADAPELIANLARTAADAAWVAIALPITDPGEEGLVVAQNPPSGGFVINFVTGDAAAAVGEPLAEHDDTATGATLVWFRVRTRTLGGMLLCREAPWSELELELLRAFADHVALAVDHESSEHDRRRLAVAIDRDRIARDLHDRVIQRIFGVGLGLQSTLRRLTDETIRDRLVGYVNDLDATVAEIRTTIFSLQSDVGRGARSLRGDVLTVLADASRVLGFEPRLTLAGPIDTAVPAQLDNDVAATLRESLSNVARHARADEVQVLVSVDPAAKTLTIQVDDNGIGIDPEARAGRGLRNADARAKAAGGYSSVVRRSGSGTSFAWVVPLPAG